MLETLKLFQEYKANLASTLILLKKYIRDTSKPLKDRWEVYLAIEDDLEIEGYYVNLPNHPDKGEITYYDDLNCDRYQTISFSHIFQRLCGTEYLEEGAVIHVEYEEMLKEYLLALGYGGCINDW
jgi:hypothetical protein